MRLRAARRTSQRIPSEYQPHAELNLAGGVRLRGNSAEIGALHARVDSAELYTVADVEGRGFEFQPSAFAPEEEIFPEGDVFADQGRRPQSGQVRAAVAEREVRRPCECGCVDVARGMRIGGVQRASQLARTHESGGDVSRE